MIPGEIAVGDGVVELNPGRARRTVQVLNIGDRPIQVGSHFHLYEANSALQMDRDAVYGYRLDVPAGSSVRFEPGIEREISVVPFVGKRIAAGFRGAVRGPLDEGDGDGRD